jgi:hypothetical protein
MALAKESFRASSTLNSVRNLSQVHASREMVEALSRKDHRADVVISQNFGQLFLQAINVFKAHQIPRRIVDAKSRYVVCD